MKTSILVIGVASIATSSFAADTAFDSAVGYTNPWNAANPQNLGTGFSGWQFETFAGPDAQTFIDTTLPAWSLTIPQDVGGRSSYFAAYRGFAGGQTLSPGDTFSITFNLRPTGGYHPPELATAGFDLFAQDPSAPSQYMTYGHQAIGFYETSSATGYDSYLGVHDVLSDENPTSHVSNPVAITATNSQPQVLTLFLYSTFRK
jgi:hypothetical protein